MRGWRGVLGGILALTALEVVVTTPYADRLGAFLTWPAAAARRFLDPSVPAIPDRSHN